MVCFNSRGMLYIACMAFFPVLCFIFILLHALYCICRCIWRWSSLGLCSVHMTERSNWCMMIQICAWTTSTKLGGGDEVRQAFARITRLISHEAYPGGPTRIIVEGTWYEFMGTCPIAQTPLVKKNKRYFMNLSSRFAFLDNCYQRPVAVWPHDPLDELSDGDPRKKWFDVIDKNQNEVF